MQFIQLAIGHWPCIYCQTRRAKQIHIFRLFDFINNVNKSFRFEFKRYIVYSIVIQYPTHGANILYNIYLFIRTRRMQYTQRSAMVVLLTVLPTYYTQIEANIRL